MSPTPYTEIRTAITSEQPSMEDALKFIGSQPQDQVVFARLEPTVNDPGKWTVVINLRTDNIDDRAEEQTS